MAPSSRKKPVEADDGGGAPEWMVTFCDCMTLLLTFFVLLLSFATFHKETMPRLGVSFAEALPALGLSRNEQRDSLWDKMSSDETVRQKEGSETRTSDTTQSSNFMREKRALDFRNLKVFSAPSEAFFWGRGAAISSQGTQVLDALAVFLRFQPARVVISENGPDGNVELGLSRAEAVLNYLVEQKGLDRRYFSLTASSMMREKSTRRQIEITLLDRSIYE
jgi:chemotaxis protein MotB